MFWQRFSAARSFRAALFLLYFASVLPSQEARAEIELLGTVTLPAEATDQSGLTDLLNDQFPQNRLAGISGIEYSGKGNRYWLLPDRGPLDGVVPFQCRLQEFEIVVDLKAKTRVQAKLVGTKLLKTERGEQLIGAAAAFDSRDASRLLRFDPEGVRRLSADQLVISDEYGPALSVFDLLGKRVKQIEVPRVFQVGKPAATPRDELIQNGTGRQPNAGFEGVALSPDGGMLYAIVQRPLIQDSQAGTGEKRVGLNCRLLEIDLKSSKTRELIYQLDDGTTGVSELLANGSKQLLALERDSLGGTEARCKKIYRINLVEATDCSRISALPVGELPSDLRPVDKQPLLDLLDSRWKIAGELCPEKFEGLTFGPDLPDGRRLLIVTVDNDFRSDRDTILYAFAVDAGDLSRPR